MSKHGPVRLDPELMENATREARRQHRSTRKQIEFWVELGRSVDGVVTREQAAGLRSGLLTVMAPDDGPIEVDDVFAELESRRPSLAARVTRSPVRYQASREHPGLLERIGPDDRVTVGRFEGGEFQPREAG